MTPEETDSALDTFWRVAVFHSRLNGGPSYFRPAQLEVVRPPAWSYGETPEEADAFLASIRSGATTATAMPLAELEQVGEPVPQPGELGIVLDGRGDPQALVSVSEVLLVPYAEVDPGFTLVEGEGLVADTPMVVQRLKVLHAG